MFTREQIEEIKTLDEGRMEYHFDCVTKSNFKRGTSSKADARLFELYYEATGKKLLLNGCKTCQYNNYTKVARLYYESKAFYEKLDEEKAGDEIVEMVSDFIKEAKPKKTNKTNKTTKKK